MEVTQLSDKNRIERYLRQETYLQIYSIGDLDDFFWPYTQWYALESNGEIQALTMLYSAFQPPVFLGLAGERWISALKQLIESQISNLPPTIYAHLNPGLDQLFRETHDLIHHGEHFKMAFVDDQPINSVDVSCVEPLLTADADELIALYTDSYPDNAFDPRMLESRKYFGVRVNQRIVSAGGIHVYSKQYRVAAIGNIVTHPDHRGRGLGTAVTAQICSALLHEVDNIGLNVKTDNEPAISCYQKLGFTPISTYHEWTITKKD